MLIFIMIILGMLNYYACITTCGMHGAHCVCCNGGYMTYSVPEIPEDTVDQIGEG